MESEERVRLSSHICKQEAALALAGVQHGAQPDAQQLRLPGQVAPDYCRKHLQQARC